MRSVLLIDDDAAVLGFLEMTFRKAGYAVTTAFTGAEGLECYATNSTDLAVLDLNLPDISGQEVLERLLRTDPDAAVIMLTGQADVETAVAAMRAGAENFLTKPVNPNHLRAAAERAFEKVELRRRSRYLEERAHPTTTLEQVPAVGAMAEVVRKVDLVAHLDTTLLLLGETGTGKSWIAARIHDQSRRRAGAFVEVNCAALSATFLSSELFGHEKGAFTDARTMKRGLLEVADGGTLFLDEIGDLSPELQPKLLTVLESRRFRRLGGTRDIETDVRLLAATNRDLQKAVAAGTFREDLYYRLAVMPILLPPLREREKAELEALARELLDRLQRGNSAARKRISPDAMRLIRNYGWPGNIREMRNVIERTLIMSTASAEITPAHLPPELHSASAPAAKPDLTKPEDELTLEEVERQHILRVLDRCGGNRSRAARILGLSRVGLYKIMRRLDEARPG